MSRFEITGLTLVRNTLINFVGHVVPLAIGVIVIPFIVRELETERFGLLSLVWVMVSCFGIFDLGLGRATTKYVAEAFGKGEKDLVPPLVWTGVTLQLMLGILGAIILISITPLIVERVLNISRELIPEASTTFYLLAPFIPIVMVSSLFSGILEARQRFDLVNLINIPYHIATVIMPLIGSLLGFRLPGILLLILGVRVASLLTYAAINMRNFQEVKNITIQPILFLKLFKFGGWLSVSSIIGPFLVYVDRFLIASILSTTAVAYYTAPYEIVTRLWIIPFSLAMTLFPAFSTLHGNQRSNKVGIYFVRAIKIILISLGPLILILILFSKDILQLWLGNNFARFSAKPLQILALGVLINSLAQMSYVLLQGVGRPDIPAKFHLLELPIHLVIAWTLIHHSGVTGAAWAWTIRITLDAFLLIVSTFKVLQVPARLFIIDSLIIKRVKIN